MNLDAMITAAESVEGFNGLVVVSDRIKAHNLMLETAEKFSSAPLINRTQNKITLKNGSVIRFDVADRREKFGGLALDGLVFNDAPQDDKIRDYLQSRVYSSRGLTG